MNVQGVAFPPQQIPPNPAFYAAQNKGTLAPGQVIQIQSLTVTVERFLSQGGFAHVYLVRTATPVNGTTQHVLKRMLVADHIMLQDVKKEVDIMRILRGHANIVNLIDSAWNRLQDGRYEVFILMEFCAGGGIIDMMNRRLRERLTEGEILQIFVDVCEGLAAMHNLQPALLHRDLKVENILQANESSYKLCDFGSATAVNKPPSTAAEMRALEYDLNRHTTLQYRAPEMVEPHLRRPIDEKSDVWALGVLLYKLCYYTTPFEEHGPLAILHVQYKIPPYPLYSQNMIGLITSILREHGTQRPTVFEILDSVHRMRGTKSRYSYNPRPHPSPGIPRSPEDIISFRPVAQAESSQNKPQISSSIQARQTVLNAIPPMRRGRPNVGGAAVAAPGNGTYVDVLDIPTPRVGHFKNVTTSERWTSAPREAPADLGGAGSRPVNQKRSSQEWLQARNVKEEPKAESFPWDGLGSLDNSEKATINGFGDTFNPAGTKQNQQGATVPRPPASSSSSSNPSISSYQPQPTYQAANTTPSTASQQSRFTMPTPSRLLQAPRIPVQTKPKDSFGDLGAPSTSAPSTSMMAMMMRTPSNASTHNGLVSAFSRPSTAADSVGSNGTGLSSAAVVEGSVALSAAERFPSIEQMELSIRDKPHGSLLRPRSPLGPRPASPAARQNLSISNRPPAYAGLSRMSYTGGLTLDHDIISPPPPVPLSGVRSQQVTGTAMKGTAPAAPNFPSTAGGTTKPNPSSSMPAPALPHSSATAIRLPLVERPPSRFLTAERPIAPNRKPIVARRRGNTMELKVDGGVRGTQQQTPVEYDLLGPGPPAGSQPLMTQRTPSPSAVPQRDWLTDDDIVLQPMAKASTGSLQPRLPTPDTTYVDPNKAKRATMGTALISFGRGNLGGVGTTKNATIESAVAGWQRGISSMKSTHQSHMPPPPPPPTNTSSGVALPGLARRVSQDGSPSRRRSNTTSSRLSQNEPPPPSLPPRPTQQPRASSPQPRRTTPQSLTDNWSPVEQRFPPTSAKSTFGEAQTGADSSGNEDGPEDVQSSTVQQMRWREQDRQAPSGSSSFSPSGVKPEQRARNVDSSPKQQHQGRQGSVHGLVDLWSGSSKPIGSQKVQEDPSESTQRFNHQKELSRDLIKFSDGSEPSQIPAQSAYSRAVHLFPPMDAAERRHSPSSGSGSEKDTDAPRPQVSQKRFSGAKGRPTQLPLDRMRPQSLFISSGGGPNQLGYLRDSPPDSLPVPSPTSNSSAPLNRQRSPRRGSISDMVSRYEALSVVSSTTSGYTASNESGPTSPKPKPVVGTKPAALRSTGMQNNMISPTGGASFFPPMDPSTLQMESVKMNAPVKMRTSPLLFKSMESPTEASQPHSLTSREQESPVINQGHSKSLNLPMADKGRSVSPGSQTGTVSDMNEDILLVSPRPRIAPHAVEHHPEPTLARARTPPVGQSPSPEQAYRGVGKLIDQWQKKTEEAEGKGRVGMKPTGPRQLQRRDIPPGKPTSTG